MTRVTHDLIYRSKSQRSRSPGRLTPWPKISHIFTTGRPTNFKLGIRMVYDDPHRRHVRWPPTWKLWVPKVTTCRGRGHIVAAELQTAQLVVVAVIVIIIVIKQSIVHFLHVPQQRKDAVLWTWESMRITYYRNILQRTSSSRRNLRIWWACRCVTPCICKRPNFEAKRDIFGHRKTFPIFSFVYCYSVQT